MKNFCLLLLTFIFINNFVSQTDSTNVPKKITPPVLNNVSNPGDIKSTPKYLPITFGPRIGVASTQLSKDDFYGRQWKPVLNAGIVFNYKINNYFSLGTEVYFTQHAKNYDYSSKSNLIPKIINNLSAFGLDQATVDLLLGGILTGTTTTFNDTIYSYTKGTFKMSTLEVPLIGSFHYKNFKFTAGAYAAFNIKSATNEESRDRVPFLDIAGPAIDTLLNQVLGGVQGFDPASFIIDPAAPNYKQAHTSTFGSVTGLASVMFGYVGDISYTFSNNVNLGVRINYPWMTFKPNVNVAYVRNTQFSASLSYYFRLKKSFFVKKSKTFSTQ